MARAVAGLAAAQAEAGDTVTVVAPGRAPGPGGAVRVVRLAALGMTMPYAPGLAAWLRRELSAHDVVHLHGHRHLLAPVVRAACRAARVPYVLQPHGTRPDHGQRRLPKRIYDAWRGAAVIRDARALVAVSHAEARDLERDAVVIGNGVAVPDRPPLARGGGPPRLLFVGNGSRQKRARALVGLLHALPQAVLTLVGPGLERVRDAFGTDRDRVTLRGPLDDGRLWPAYEEADLLLQPSAGEAFGLAVFEAALLGTPAVVAGGHGAGEWFGQAGGCVVPADDATAWAQAVHARLQSPLLGRGEAEAVAAFTRSRLTWARAAADVRAVYVEARSLA